VDGRPLDSDFARGTAYAEQMDVHEGTATVREAMRFSAYLRQPASVSQAEKDDYVEEMIELLELQDLADALVFGLNVEARKRLTIGVELASKPELLLFLDEPTSGLDAQSAWNLVRFLRKLANQGQAILCTIHQPSSLLFESFDRLLLLETGKPVCFLSEVKRCLSECQVAKRSTLVTLVWIRILFGSISPVMELSVLLMSIRLSTCWKPSEQASRGNWDVRLTVDALFHL
jgi:ABC-type multidrug transport system ATPase subunit